MPIRFNFMDGDLEKSAYERERARKMALHINPRNPHHGIDCICDSCCQYWGNYKSQMAEAIAAQRASQQAIDASGEGSDSTSDQGADSGKKEILPPLIEADQCPRKRDCPSDPSAGNPLTYPSGG